MYAVIKTGGKQYKVEEGDRLQIEKIAGEKPYREWIDAHMITLKDLPEAVEEPLPPQEELEKLEKVFGYTYEDLKTIILPMAREQRDEYARLLRAAGTDVIDD